MRTDPPPATRTGKVVQQDLDDLEAEMSSLKEKRKELLFEIAKIEAAEEIHDAEKDIKDAEEARNNAEARAEAAEEKADCFAEALSKFGGHSPACLQGALAGAQALHPLCTCGWNDVATDIERQ